MKHLLRLHPAYIAGFIWTFARNFPYKQIDISQCVAVMMLILLLSTGFIFIRNEVRNDYTELLKQSIEEKNLDVDTSDVFSCSTSSCLSIEPIDTTIIHNTYIPSPHLPYEKGSLLVEPNPTIQRGEMDAIENPQRRGYGQ